MGTLIQLTTTATLALCWQVNGMGIANAAQLGQNSPKNPSTPTVLTVAQTSRTPSNPRKYEPDPNGNPNSDGTGTR